MGQVTIQKRLALMKRQPHKTLWSSMTGTITGLDWRVELVLIRRHRHKKAISPRPTSQNAIRGHEGTLNEIGK